MRYQVLADDDKHDETLLLNSFCDETFDIDEEPINLARIFQEKSQKNKFYCGYELCPTKNKTVYARFFSETQECSPTFYSLTWHENLTSFNEEQYPSLESANLLPRRKLLLHCAAKDLTRAQAEEILNRALKLGITNIFALRGNGEAVTGDFPHASDFVLFIRERFGQQFCIGVTGYPEMHPNSPLKALDLLHLKVKVDAGADFIISQIFFESHLFIQFVKDCRESGVSIPIIPGVFPFSNVNSLKRMSKICQIKVPAWLNDKLIDLEGDDQAATKYGIELSVKIITEIWETGVSNGYHLFILNRSFAAVEIYHQLKSHNYLID